jgi:hypothetical protein
LRYDFPRDIEFKEGDTLALSNLHIYLSWFNISAKYNNNRIQYKWYNNIDGIPDDLFTIDIPDGFYSIQTLNEYFISVMTQRGHYLETLDGKNHIYFIELTTNSTYYSTSFRLSSLSDQYDFGEGLQSVTEVCKAPTTWVLPSTFQAPEVIIPSNNNLGELLGYKPQTLRQDTTGEIINKTYSFLSNFAPNMMPSSSYIMTSNLVDNEMGIPNNILYSFTVPNNTGFGDLISPHNDLVYSKIKPGIYRHIEIQIYDQEFRPLIIQDPNMLINLSILKKLE